MADYSTLVLQKEVTTYDLNIRQEYPKKRANVRVYYNNT